MRLLEQALQMQPDNADAHLLYQDAATEALGNEELRELARLYPSIIADATSHRLRTMSGTPEEILDGLEIVLSTVGSEGSVRVDGLLEVRGALLGALLAK